MTSPGAPPRDDVPGDDAPGVDIDASVLFRMVRIVNLLTRTFPGPAQAQPELSLLEWRVLAVVACHSRTTMTEIAHFTGYNRMNVSRALRSLEGHGLMDRLVDPDDRRRNVADLTPAGLALYRRISTEAMRLDRAVLHNTGGPDLEATSRVLDRILANLYTLIEGEDGAEGEAGSGA